MTGLPPPPPGNYPPPPAGPVVRGLPRQAYTWWTARVLAFLIDRGPVVVIVLAGVVVFSATSFTTTELTVLLTTPLLALAHLIWNFGYRQGITGSSIAKSAMKFKVVSQDTGQPIGFWMSVLRQLAHFVDAIMSTVCLPRR
ncbi:MAG TPA: RDD family protein [Mycobacterium sp.]|nr:RDD family protein [Mycobacterium sp.]